MSIKIRIDITEQQDYSDDVGAMPNHCHLAIESDMTEATHHQWMALAVRLMRSVGFEESGITDAACGVAFKGGNNEEVMKKLYEKYDLAEFHTFSEQSHASSSRAKTDCTGTGLQPIDR